MIKSKTRAGKNIDIGLVKTLSTSMACHLVTNRMLEVGTKNPLCNSRKINHFSYQDCGKWKRGSVELVSCVFYLHSAVNNNL